MARLYPVWAAFLHREKEQNAGSSSSPTGHRYKGLRFQVWDLGAPPSPPYPRPDPDATRGKSHPFVSQPFTRRFDVIDPQPEVVQCRDVHLPHV